MLELGGLRSYTSNESVGEKDFSRVIVEFKYPELSKEKNREYDHGKRWFAQSRQYTLWFYG